MKPTEKQAAEILKTYRDYWEAYFAGDLKAFGARMHDKVTIFGSSLSEVFRDRKSAIKFYKATEDQITDKVQLRGRKIRVCPVNDSLLVTEESDAYLKDGKKWIFYDHVRISALFQQTAGGWKLVHQHASFPDARTEEGNQLAAEKIKKENQELREAVRRRTVELEAKNRELEMEAALEKVRSVAMGMQAPADMLRISKAISRQLTKLGIRNIRNVQCAIFGNHSEHYLDYTYFRLPRKSSIHVISTRKAGEARSFVEQMRGNPQAYFTTSFKGARLKKWMELQEKMGYYLDPHLREAGSVHNYFFSIGTGALGISTYAPLDDDSIEILKRFRDVFDLAYKRHADISKAEAQAREAQIEASLERIRSVSMAMRKSDELFDIIRTVFGEWKKLGVEFYECNINLLDRSKKEWINWGTGIGDATLPTSVKFQWFDDPIVNQLYEDSISGISYRTYLLEGEVMKHFLDGMYTHTDFKYAPEQYRKELYSIPKQFLSHAFMKYGSMDLVGPEEPPAPTIEILKRFAKVFEQAYTRYLDLQKAEAQAREAQIEAALERVRAKVMAMNNSKDLDETSLVFGEQLRKLGIDWQFSYFWLVDETKDENTFWITWPDFKTSITIYTLAEAAQYFNECLVEWRKGTRIHDNFVPKPEVQAWLDTFQRIADDAGGVANEVMQAKNFPEGVFYYDAMMKYGSFGICINKPATDEQKNIQCRFAIEFERAYTRFLDLKTAETQAHRARIETALERVRARALAMQEPEELVDVARVLRQEMGQLGVEALETGTVFIHDTASETAECWFAIRDQKHADKKLIADHIRLDLNATWVGKQMLDFFERDDVQVSIPMRGQRRKEWIEYCYGLSSILDGYYGAHIPDRVYHLYKFSNGAIGAAAPGDISAESWELLQRTASVFSLAYSRFRDLSQARTDLQRLKEEKHRAETALLELRTTQAQLIQSEKMASLGELTAGIAHEIQNPLNFVNNFSELSNELIDEMQEEMEKGNAPEALKIAADIQENLEKINLHGKRADAIVKNMLQHSRTSGTEKEPTDINALADEYLRLAYHGYRAKDKLFNATMEVDFDPDLGKIMVVPQDIGRVLLNLYNNAFYAVDKKAKAGIDGYLPAIAVLTRRQGRGITIEVRDNGDGIPDAIRDKIFQPFFTTKPTGQGTGLGLSLSYDIVTKGHGGEIEIQSEEGRGTSFMLRLPVL